VKGTTDIVDMRSAVRFPLRLRISVRHEQRHHDVETHNISAGGVLFQFHEDLAVGSRIEFTIAMPAAVLGAEKDVLVNCIGRVVRCSADAAGRTVAAVIDEYRFERS
jgi:hypothetical protein